MAESKYLKKTQGNGASTTLSASITNADTSAPLTSDTAFDGEGMLLIDEGQATEEFAYGTGKIGSSVTILADDRGLEGGSAQAHSDSATVKGVITSGMWNNVIASLTNVCSDTTGALDTTKVIGITSGNIDSSITGWITPPDTWTYASATTFTIAGVDRRAMFPKGTKIKLTQGTVKYFYVVGSAFSTNTTITITAGTSYTLANAAITSPYYSYASTPRGFPTSFAWTPSWTNVTIGDATVAGRFSVDGHVCRFDLIVAWGAGTSGSGNQGFSPPIAIGSDVSSYESIGHGLVTDTNLSTPYVTELMRDSSSTTNIRLITNSGNVTAASPMTWTTGDVIRVSGSYRI